VSLKYTLRGTGIGLVAAGAVIAGIQYMGITEADFETGAQASELNIEEALALLEDHTEFFVIPEKKYNELTTTLSETELELEALKEEKEKREAESNEEAESAEEGTDEETNEEAPAVVNQTIFSIEAGMNSKDIAAELKVLEIIEDEREFERYLLDQEVDRYLRTGRYRLDSGMSFQEIVTVLTN
jgi:hypothetical protein